MTPNKHIAQRWHHNYNPLPFHPTIPLYEDIESLDFSLLHPPHRYENNGESQGKPKEKKILKLNKIAKKETKNRNFPFVTWTIG